MKTIRTRRLRRTALLAASAVTVAATVLGAGAGGVVDPGEHGAAGDLAEDLARQARGGQAGRDGAESAMGLRH